MTDTKQNLPATMPQGSRGVVLANMNDLARFAQWVVDSRLAPKGLESPQAIALAIQLGLELGLTPMSALQNIAVINGKPGVYGDAALALVRASGLLEFIEEAHRSGKTDDDFCAVCTTKRRGDPAPRVTTFSIKDAKRARLWGKPGPWTDYPQRMLMFRARGFNLRDNFPDVLKGFKTVEELQDYQSLPPAHVAVKRVHAEPIQAAQLPAPANGNGHPEQPEGEISSAEETEYRRRELVNSLGTRIAEAAGDRAALDAIQAELVRHHDTIGEPDYAELLRHLKEQLAAVTPAKRGKPKQTALPGQTAAEREPGMEG